MDAPKRHRHVCGFAFVTRRGHRDLSSPESTDKCELKSRRTITQSDLMNPRTINYLGLTLSLSALCYTAWLHRRMDIVAKQSIREREAELVKFLTPQMLDLYRGFGVGKELIPASPTTFEELFRPASQPLQTISQMPGGLTPSGPQTNRP